MSEMIERPQSDNAQVSLSQAAIRHMASADFYDLIALLLEVPTPEGVALLARPELAEDFGAIASELGVSAERAAALTQRFAAMSESLSRHEDALGLLRREYTRLFSHPKKPVIQLYEGVFVDEELVRAGKPSTHAFLFVNPSAEEAERSYKEAGFARTHKSSVPADSVITELQFMGQLHLAAAKADIEYDAPAAAAAAARLEGFASQRIVRWVPRFFERCVEESRVELYALLGEAGGLLMEVEGFALAAHA